MPSEIDGLPELVAELRELIAVLKPLAEKAVLADHIWESPGPTKNRREKESAAIVLAATMDRPTLSGIAKELGVPRSTLRRWAHLNAAIAQRSGPVREGRRGIVTDGDVDGIE